MVLPADEFPESGATFPLEGEGLRNWLRTSGQSLFTEFGSGAELLDFLRLNGVSIRTQDFYGIRQEVLSFRDSVLSNEAPLFNIGDQYPNSLIPMGYTIFDHGFDLSSNFLYRFRIESANPQTGDVQYQYMAVGSDRQLTFSEAQDLMQSLFTGEYIEGGYNVTDMAIDAAFGRPDMVA